MQKLTAHQIVHRLQGADFDENYTSTPQIEVANIPWHYKGTVHLIERFSLVFLCSHLLSNRLERYCQD